jgi:hypothetical protein
MDNVVLFRSLRKLTVPLQKKFHCQVLCHDQFYPSYMLTAPNIEKIFVINTDSYTGPGEHWVLLYQNPKGLEFFDSYGMPAEMYNINLPKGYIRNDRLLQSVLSDVCGHHVLYYITQRLKTCGSMDEVLKYWYTKQPEVNDNMVHAFTRSRYCRDIKDGRGSKGGGTHCCQPCYKVLESRNLMEKIRKHVYDRALTNKRIVL